VPLRLVGSEMCIRDSLIPVQQGPELWRLISHRDPGCDKVLIKVS
jgi:hypothetical protein